jgi:hypothetical protein
MWFISSTAVVTSLATTMSFHLFGRRPSTDHRRHQPRVRCGSLPAARPSTAAITSVAPRRGSSLRATAFDRHRHQPRDRGAWFTAFGRRP